MIPHHGRTRNAVASCVRVLIFGVGITLALGACATATAPVTLPPRAERPPMPQPTLAPQPIGRPVVQITDSAAAELEESLRAATVLLTASGEATYYADRFDGRYTTSGIVFRQSQPYAAHREYPFGTVVRVTNVANGRSVILRVVDRGPHGTSERAKRTIIDVSRSAAEALGFVRAGRIPVRVDVLEWGDGRTYW